MNGPVSGYHSVSHAASETPLPPRHAGGSGSGKSTLAEALAAKLPVPCALIEHDCYYRDLSHLPVAVRAQADFDAPEALENELLCAHLRALKAGRGVRVPRYDFAAHTRRAESDLVQPAQVILVVGILLLSEPALRALFDASVFVEAPACVRFVWRLVRDVGERGRTLESVVQQYLATVRPAHERLVQPTLAHADLVVSGMDLEGSLRSVAERLPRGNCAALPPVLSEQLPCPRPSFVGGRGMREDHEATNPVAPVACPHGAGLRVAVVRRAVRPQ